VRRAARLDDRFRLLTGGSRAALPRQRTLRALVDWSYGLLQESERLLLRRLSVFAGGWTLEAAETICSGDGLQPNDVVDLLMALSFHAGEVQRNPYHVRMPAWLIDNVRRGGELVGGQGGPAPDFQFATLYRFRRWREGQFEDVFKGGNFLAAGESPATLFS